MSKKIICIFLIIILLLCSFACGDMDVILDIELTELPKKQEYEVDRDKSINFSGGRIALITGHETIFGIDKNNGRFSDPIEEYIDEYNVEIKYITSFDDITYEDKKNFNCCIVTDVNFSKAGEYTVRIYHYPDKYAEYNIRVIENKTN